MSRKYTNGRSTDGWMPLDKITKDFHAAVGNVLIVYSHEYESQNLCLVTHANEQGFTYVYADPRTLGTIKFPAMHFLYDLPEIGGREYFIAGNPDFRPLPMPPMPEYFSDPQERLIDQMIQIGQYAIDIARDEPQSKAGDVGGDMRYLVSDFVQSVKGIQPSNTEIDGICGEILAASDSTQVCCKLCVKATGEVLEWTPVAFYSPGGSLDQANEELADKETGLAYVEASKIEDGIAVEYAPALEEPEQPEYVHRYKLNLVEAATLAEFAAKHGRTFKSKLRAEWAGKLEDATAPILWGLQNSHCFFGPKGLERYRTDDRYGVGNYGSYGAKVLELREDAPHTWNACIAARVANYLAAHYTVAELEGFLDVATKRMNDAAPHKTVPSDIAGRINVVKMLKTSLDPIAQSHAQEVAA